MAAAVVCVACDRTFTRAATAHDDVCPACHAAERPNDPEPVPALDHREIPGTRSHFRQRAHDRGWDDE